MAITVSGDLGFSNITANPLISGFNPCLINFKTDQSGGVRGVMNIYRLGSSFAISTNITPDGNGVFYYDFNGGYKDFAYESENYYEPQFSYPDISTANNAVYLDTSIATGIEWDFNIYDSDNLSVDNVGSGGYFFLKASTQVGNLPIMDSYSIGLSADQNSLNTSEEGVIVWKGYPIDLQTDSHEFDTASIVILGIVVATKVESKIDDQRIVRTFLIDALGNELNGLDNINSGNVTVRLTNSVGTGYNVSTNYDYRIPKCPDNAKYFRYNNINGGQSYFLFENTFKTKTLRENRDNINRRFDSLETASSRTVSLGNYNFYSLTCSYRATSKLENDLLQGLILSPVIQLWDAESKTFNRVNLINPEMDDLSSKTEVTNYLLTFDLGQKYN